jgi:hypothetical protein
MTDRLALATRTMKARHNSTCPSCRGPVLIGQQIARLADPPAWVHVRCVPVVAAMTKDHLAHGGQHRKDTTIAPGTYNVSPRARMDQAAPDQPEGSG